MIANNTAMGRLGLPDDIGSTVASLLAADTQWMTAQRIEISGGQNLYPTGTAYTRWTGSSWSVTGDSSVELFTHINCVDIP